MKFGARRSVYKKCTDLKSLAGFCLPLSNKSCGRTADVRHSVHCAKGKKRQREFIYQCASCITGIGVNMLLFFFLALIANSALVSGACDLGRPKLKNFKWTKVGISVLICLL